MIPRNKYPHSPTVQELFDENPRSMSLSLFISTVCTYLNIYNAPMFALLSSAEMVELFRGLILKVKEMIPRNEKVKSNIETMYFHGSSSLHAQFNAENGTPVLESYSDQEQIQATVEACFLGNDYIHDKYFQTMYLMARVALKQNASNVWEKLSLIPDVLIREQMQDTISAINYEVWKRGINIEYSMEYLHYSLLELNKCVLDYNSAHAASGQTKPFVKIDDLLSLRFFNSIVEVIKPDDLLGTLFKKALGHYPVMGCTNTYLQKQNVISRGLDWPQIQDFGNKIFWTKKPTGHTDLNLPTFVYTLGIYPNIPVAIGINDELVVIINVGGNKFDAHKNTDGGYGSLDIVDMILKNCLTLKDVEKLLDDHPCASPCIINVISKEEGAVFDILPPKMENEKSRPLYRVKKGSFIATNHHQGQEESAAVPCSVERYKKVEEALKDMPDNLSWDQLWELARIPATDDTCASIIVLKNEKGEIIVEWNISNKNSATAIDSDINKFFPDKMNIHQDARHFLHNVANKKIPRVLSTSVDKALKELCLASAKAKSGEVAQLMRNIYSQLMAENSRLNTIHQYKKSELNLNIKQIEEIAVMAKKIGLGKATVKELKAFEETLLQLEPEFFDSINYLYVLGIFGATVGFVWDITTSLSWVQAGLTWMSENLSATVTIANTFMLGCKMFLSPSSSPNALFFSRSLVEKCRELPQQESRNEGVMNTM